MAASKDQIRQWVHRWKPKAGWTVRRHSGRSDGEWRTVYCGTEQKARAKFKRIECDMRQGGVELVDPDGKQQSYAWAPRLRTRW
jgi:hypothetical protein